MSDDVNKEQALMLMDRAYRHQMKREYGLAILLFKRSLTLWPSAEAYTHLGLTYSTLNRYEEAIACCKNAIEVDPSFGNPYNDIGTYLIELDQWEEAIPWLEKALTATRYESPQLPQLNLGRVYEHLGRNLLALQYFDQALEIDPYFQPAIWAKYQLLSRLN